MSYTIFISEKIAIVCSIGAQISYVLERNELLRKRFLSVSGHRRNVFYYIEIVELLYGFIIKMLIKFLRIQSQRTE